MLKITPEGSGRFQKVVLCVNTVCISTVAVSARNSSTDASNIVFLLLQVDACAPRARFATAGIAACTLNTTAPGKYTLDFSILDTATNLRITRTRTLLVLTNCFVSEPRCLDLSCGTGGTCAGGEFVPTVNTAPVLELTRSASQNAYGVVLVKMGTVYEACEPGQVFICIILLPVRYCVQVACCTIVLATLKVLLKRGLLAFDTFQLGGCVSADLCCIILTRLLLGDSLIQGKTHPTRRQRSYAF